MDRRLLVLSIGMFALGTDGYVVAGVLPQIAQAFGVSIGAAGQLTSAYAFTFALLAPTIAAIAARVPRKTLMLGGLGIFVAANLATALAPTYGVALLTRILAGLGAAMFSPTATGSAATLVAPDRRGHALAIVMAGLSGATALGAPIGAVIGGLGDWRWTMVFVSALAGIALVGSARWLKDVPLLPGITLAQRLAPLADVRIGLTLATTLLAMTGIFTNYTYLAVVFDRAIGGHTAVIGALMVLWGLGGTVANLRAGRLIDTVGSRKVIVICLLALGLDFALMPWTSASLWTAIPAILVWGMCGWAILVPQQHRLVTLVPSIAPILLGLNTACTYLGITLAGLIGAAGLSSLGAHQLGWVAIVPIMAGLVLAELAGRSIQRNAACDTGSASPASPASTASPASPASQSMAPAGTTMCSARS